VNLYLTGYISALFMYSRRTTGISHLKKHVLANTLFEILEGSAT